MSYRQQSSWPINFSNAVMSPKDASKAVNNILNMPHKKAILIVGRTSVTAYRHVHEIMASAIDEVIRVLNSFRISRPSSQVQIARYNSEVARLSVLVSRALIMVKYQEARGQISRDLSNALDTMLNILSNKLQGLIGQYREKDIVETIQVAENARLLIDAIAVLVYNYGRK